MSLRASCTVHWIISITRCSNVAYNWRNLSRTGESIRSNAADFSFPGSIQKRANLEPSHEVGDSTSKISILYLKMEYYPRQGALLALQLSRILR